MQISIAVKAACAALIILTTTASCSPATQTTTPPAGTATASPPAQAQPQPAQPAVTDNSTPPFTNVKQPDGPPVQITLVHYRGTPEEIGCCNKLLYEMDEYVAIKNMSDTPQDIRGWKLANLTKGYPTFTFPDLFPCIPAYEPEFQPRTGVDNAFYRRNENPPDSVSAMFTGPTGFIESVPRRIDWSQCNDVQRIDETPMKPLNGAAYQPVPCILYPGQTVLVFTNEIHCKYGGFSFSFGQGNIWDNQQPNTAVLYNDKGDEVSRRSYFTGR